MPEEQLILVDERNRAIGTAGKAAAHRRDLLHRAFSIFVVDASGRIVLQQRNRKKYHSGGLWANSCCGHPRPGEDVAAAALRRLVEEMGFTCALTGLGTVRYHAAFDNGLFEHEVVHVFRGVYDGPITPDPMEADGFQWARLADIAADIAATPERFSVWFRQYVAAEWPMALASPGESGFNAR